MVSHGNDCGGFGETPLNSVSSPLKCFFLCVNERVKLAVHGKKSPISVLLCLKYPFVQMKWLRIHMHHSQALDCHASMHAYGNEGVNLKWWLTPLDPNVTLRPLTKTNIKRKETAKCNGKMMIYSLRATKRVLSIVCAEQYEIATITNLGKTATHPLLLL